MAEEEQSKELYPKNPRGTHVSTKAFMSGEVTTTWWEPEVQYAWALGPAMSRFLKELKNGKIVARKCRKCKRVIAPPRMFCEYCYKPTDEWVEIPDTGTINTFSKSYLDSDANRIEEPILIGVIELDGASPMHGIMHYFGEMDPDDIEIGMHVKAVWKAEEERTGAITDIKYFRPLTDEEAAAIEEGD